MEPLRCPETSVTTNLHYVTTRESEDSHLHGVGRLKCVNLKLSVSKKAKSGSNPNILWTSTAAGDTFVSGLLAILLHQGGISRGMETTGKKRQIEVTENSPFIVVESLGVPPAHIYILPAALVLQEASPG